MFQHIGDVLEMLIVARCRCQQHVTSLRSCSVSSVTWSWQRWTAPVAVLRTSIFGIAVVVALVYLHVCGCWCLSLSLQDATLELARMGLCGVSEVFGWCKPVGRECVGRGCMHVMLHASLRTCFGELSAMVFAWRLRCFIAVHVGKTSLCVTMCASLGGSITLREVWTKMRFLELFSRFAPVANGTILYLFLCRATCSLQD